MKIRTLVVDDEPLARTRILTLLRQFDFIQVIGEGKNGREALRMINDYRPDLVFLDVQMPDLNGFDVLGLAEKETLPFIIFVTAYDQYALQAFDVHAVDYLLKPYDDERFARAVEHARHHLQIRQNALLHHKVIRLIEDHRQQTGNALEYLEVTDKGIPHRIKTDDIHFFEAHGNYLKVYLFKRSYLIRQTLQSMSETLGKPYFLRIHRSALINTNFLDRMRYHGNNQYAFQMKNGTELLSSRSHKAEIDQFLQDEKLRRHLFRE